MSQWYGHPRALAIPISKTLVIWTFPVTLTLTQIAKVIWEGDAHITRVLGMGMPKTPGWPYHCDTGLLPQKGKRDLNGEQPCTVVVVVVVVFIPTEIKEVHSSNCCPATCYLSNWYVELTSSTTQTRLRWCSTTSTSFSKVLKKINNYNSLSSMAYLLCHLFATGDI